MRPESQGGTQQHLQVCDNGTQRACIAALCDVSELKCRRSQRCGGGEYCEQLEISLELIVKMLICFM